MPNWCSNNIHLQHEDPKMVKRAVDSLIEGKFFQEFIPCPEELYDTESTMGYATSKDHEKQMQENVSKHGYTDWYSWCTDNWGTKWDVGCEEVLSINSGYNDNTTEIQFYFDSAWCPPIKAYEKLTEMGFDIQAYYYEPGCSFCGKWESDGGDFYYDVPETIEEALEEIPDDILDEFGIIDDIESQIEEL
jgi:hypothetical protein